MSSFICLEVIETNWCVTFFLVIQMGLVSELNILLHVCRTGGGGGWGGGS